MRRWWNISLIGVVIVLGLLYACRDLLLLGRISTVETPTSAVLPASLRGVLSEVGVTGKVQYSMFNGPRSDEWWVKARTATAGEATDTLVARGYSREELGEKPIDVAGAEKAGTLPEAFATMEWGDVRKYLKDVEAHLTQVYISPSTGDVLIYHRCRK